LIKTRQRRDALLQVLCPDHPLLASRAQGECDRLPPGKSLIFADPLRFLTQVTPSKLKKSLNQVVQELASLGFSPEVVRDLVKQGNDALNAMRDEPSPDKQTTIILQPDGLTSTGLRLLYEVDNDLGHLVPHLRLIVDNDADMDTAVSEGTHDKDSNPDAGP